MSQTDFPAVDVPVPQQNTLAIVGLVVSVLGLLGSGGILCPIGLIISLIALGKPYGRGWAIGGVVVGLLGTCFGVVAIVFLGAAVMAAIAVVGAGLGVFALVATQGENIQISADMLSIADSVVIYEDKNGSLPEDLDALDIDKPTLMDPWGRPYRYILTERKPGFEITSWGADGQPATDDDVRVTELDMAWDRAFENMENFEAQITKWIERMKRLKRAGVVKSDYKITEKPDAP
ncbi:MAG: type II secretion system protein GspG [Planctomycetes bacterium]|nr:type II secretion system protein GspG [Planctomycetota bacterium]